MMEATVTVICVLFHMAACLWIDWADARKRILQEQE